MAASRSLWGAARGALADTLGTLVLLARDRLVWRLAHRNVGRNLRRSAIVVAAVASGLAGSLLTMGLNLGFLHQMVQTVIETQLGHVQVHAAGWEQDPGLDVRIGDAGRVGADVLEETAGVRAWAPRVRSEGLVFSPRASVGVSLLAVDPEREGQVSVVAESVTQGAWLDGARRLVLGERLARRLEVGLDDKVVVSAQDALGDVTGESFRVGGLFRTASSGLDESVVFLPLDSGRRMLRLGDEVSEFVIVADDDRDADAIEARLQEALGSAYEVRTWEDLQPLLVYMIEMFESVGWVIYAAVFIAMTFGIANVLLMSVHERIREIGVQMAVGMSARRVVAMVLAEGIWVSALGVAAGLLATGLLLFWLRDGIDLTRWAEGLNEFGIATHLAPIIRPHDLATPLLVASVTAVVASLWPAVRAARTRPADAVRRI